MKKATCPKDALHDRFVTTAHVMEEWEVSPTGDFIDMIQTLQTTHGPDFDNTWTCAICGTTAKIVDNSIDTG